MSLIALATWIATAGAGLYLLSIWLIEYDKDYQAVAATRLPPTVLVAHVLLALGGMLAWIGYIILDQDRLAWTAVGAVLLAATLGTTMAIRWVRVYRAGRAARRRHAELAAAGLTVASGRGRVATLEHTADVGPPERNFPLPVVVAHGAFAAVTITLVLLTALGVGGS
jgi:uncharacterized membrane protein